LSQLVEISQKQAELSFGFSFQKDSKIFFQASELIQKVLFWFSETLKRIFLSWHSTFKEIFKCHNKNLSSAKHKNYFNVGGLKTG
jgi:hypothetical protein